MPTNPRGPADQPVSAGRAADTLADLDSIETRSRRAASTALTRVPLASWGVAWLVGFALLDSRPWRVAVPIGLLLALAAMALTWVGRSPQVRSGREGRVGLGWLALMLCSPFLVATIGPVPARVEILFLGALWGVALLLYGVASADIALCAVGVLIVLGGAFSRPVSPPHALLVSGLVGGASMLALGGWRTWRAGR